jgi:hypothetical protein
VRPVGFQIHVPAAGVGHPPTQMDRVRRDRLERLRWREHQPGAVRLESREGFKELERREGEEGAAVGGGAGWLVEDPANAPGVGRPRRGGGLERFGVAGSGWPVPGSRFGLDAQAGEGEGRAGAVADEPLAAGAVGAVDADGGVDAESAGALPGEHVVYGVLIEEAAALEEAENAALEYGGEGGCVVGGQVGGLVETDPVVELDENAVEDHEVEVEVGIEGGAEAVKEGDGADLRVGSSAEAAAAQCGADGAEQDWSTAPARAGS